MCGSTYVVVTSAKNEELYIGHTLESVVSQSVLPLAWVIVDDGSIDNTVAIVKGYSRRFPFIQLVSRKAGHTRNFASKVYAIRKGYALVQVLSFDYVAIQDADCSLPEDYFISLMAKFRADPRLGITGGVYYELLRDRWMPYRTNPQWSVSGGIQMFRRPCFDAMDGYVAIRGGMGDAVAEVSARMNGWKVEAVPDLRVRHYRPVGTARGHILRTRYAEGWQEYLIGYHPMFSFMKQICRLNERPILAGSIARIVGYVAAKLAKPTRPVSEHFVSYLRKEQTDRMLSCLPWSSNVQSREVRGPS